MTTRALKIRLRVGATPDTARDTGASADGASSSPTKPLSKRTDHSLALLIVAALVFVGGIIGLTLIHQETTPRQTRDAVKTIRTTASFTASQPRSERAATTSSITAPTTPAESHSSASIAVRRAQLTTAIRNREPLDRLEGIVAAPTSTSREVIYFTELRGLAGRTLVHRWYYADEVVAEVTFKIRADRWRVYSSKTLPPHLKGRWRVDVVDKQGDVLASEAFIYR